MISNADLRECRSPDPKGGVPYCLQQDTKILSFHPVHPWIKIIVHNVRPDGFIPVLLQEKLFDL